MTAIEALEAMKKIPRGDQEVAHCDADQILLDFLKSHDPACKEVAEAFEAARDRIGFWYT